MGCIIVQEAWSNFKEIRARCSLNPRLDSWEDVMPGEIPQPHNVAIEKNLSGKWVNYVTFQ